MLKTSGIMSRRFFLFSRFKNVVHARSLKYPSAKADSFGLILQFFVFGWAAFNAHDGKGSKYKIILLKLDTKSKRIWPFLDLAINRSESTDCPLTHRYHFHKDPN